MLKVAIGLLLIAFLPSIDGRFINVRDGVNGGVDCATCSILLGIVDHVMIVYNDSASQALERICSFFPAPYKDYCKTALDFLGK